MLTASVRPQIRTQFIHLLDDPADPAPPVALRLTITARPDRPPVTLDVPLETGEEVVHVVHADVGATVWVATTLRLVVVEAVPVADRVEAEAVTVDYTALDEVRAALEAPVAGIAVATTGRVLDLLTTDRRKAAALTAWLRRRRGTSAYGESRSRTHAPAWRR